MRKTFFILLTVLILMFTLIVTAWSASPRERIIEQAKKEGVLVLMGSLADEFATRLKGFRKKYPFIKIKDIGSNTKKTVSRIVMEAHAGRVSVDVFDTGDDGGYLLARAGVLQKPQTPWPHLKNIDPRMRPSSGLFVPYLEYPRPQGAYNTDMVKPDEVPSTWEELVSPKWKGKVMLSPSAEELPGQFAYLWRKGNKLNWERSFDFFRKIAALKPLITSGGYTKGNEMLAAGQRPIFLLTVIGQPIVFNLQRGAPTALIAFDKFPTTMRVEGIVKGAPHPAAAWLWIDYLLSPEGQFELTDVVRPGMPVNNLAKPGKLAKFSMKQGITRERTPFSDPDTTLDNHAELTYTDAAIKKSEEFFYKLLGIQ